MAYSEGQLNGAADYRVGIEVWYSGAQDWGANTSRFDWRVWFQNPTAWGSWSGSTQYWSASIGGVGYSGTFGIPQSERYNKSRIIASGSTWHGHDSNGFRGGFASNAYINTDHSNIGDGGSGDAWVDAPRIPKTPLAPGTPVVSNLKPTEATLSWTGTPDSRGAAIDQYLLRVHKISPANSPGYTDYPNSGTTFSRKITGLTPGTQYYAVVYARNSRGFSPKSGERGFKTLSGAYAWNGSQWRPTEVLARTDANAWAPAEVQTRKTSAWEVAS